MKKTMKYAHFLVKIIEKQQLTPHGMKSRTQVLKHRAYDICSMTKALTVSVRSELRSSLHLKLYSSATCFNSVYFSHNLCNKNYNTRLI